MFVSSSASASVSDKYSDNTKMSDKNPCNALLTHLHRNGEIGGIPCTGIKTNARAELSVVANGKLGI